LTLESAKELEGTTFDVALPDGTVTSMRLDEAVPFLTQQRRRSRGPTPRRQPFALYFLGSPATILPQGIYSFRSESASFDQLFIVPVGRDEEATEYEAVFS